MFIESQTVNSFGENYRNYRNEIRSVEYLRIGAYSSDFDEKNHVLLIKRMNKTHNSREIKIDNKLSKAHLICFKLNLEYWSNFNVVFDSELTNRPTSNELSSSFEIKIVEQTK